jgi:hypothetical protein
MLVFDDEDGGCHAGMLHRCARITVAWLMRDPWYPIGRYPGASPFRPRRRAAAQTRSDSRA